MSEYAKNLLKNAEVWIPDWMAGEVDAIFDRYAHQPEFADLIALGTIGRLSKPSYDIIRRFLKGEQFLPDGQYPHQVSRSIILGMRSEDIQLATDSFIRLCNSLLKDIAELEKAVMDDPDETSELISRQAMNFLHRREDAESFVDLFKANTAAYAVLRSYMAHIDTQISIYHTIWSFISLPANDNRMLAVMSNDVVNWHSTLYLQVVAGR
ncbi:MAG: hypothetical protein ACOYUZ_01400 [Patescibacteria group bacterium]